MPVPAVENYRDEPETYQVLVEGKIGADWSDWLDGMLIEPGEALPGIQSTLLTGRVADQAALRGILCRLWDLNLVILSVNRLKTSDHAGPDAFTKPK